jgi:hypothetical protein
MAAKKKNRSANLSPVRAAETHAGDVRVVVGQEAVIVSRKVAFGLAIELLLACTGVGKRDLFSYLSS